MIRVTFTIQGAPRGKGRPRFARCGNHVKTYTDAKTTAYERMVQLCWKQQSGQRMPDGVPIKAYVRAYFPIPKSASKKRRAELEGTPHTKKCDIDNLLKSVFDALNGVAYTDDSAICYVVAAKIYSASPRVEVVLESIGE
jgi:Holliday junction resolvase RusA-like endonuclease